jgi:SNF2 family DNA or RNA helicase
VSNYTQTLDLFVALAKMRGWGYVRLDGSTARIHSRTPAYKALCCCDHIPTTMTATLYSFLLACCLPPLRINTNTDIRSAVKKRQIMVDQLRDRKNNIYLFLLSSKVRHA